VLAGLSKNAHEGLATPALIGPWTLLLLGGQTLPWLLLAFAGSSNERTIVVAAIAAGVSLLPRWLAARRFRQSWLGALLHPLGITLFVGVQWWSLARRLFKQSPTWKGRRYDQFATARPTLHQSATHSHLVPETKTFTLGK